MQNYPVHNILGSVVCKETVKDCTALGQNFFISWFTGNFFQIKGRGDEKKKKKSSENDQSIIKK